MQSLPLRTWRHSAPLALGLVVALAASAHGQARDQVEDGNAARTDAIFGTPNVVTPGPEDSLFATTPGLERQLRRSQFTISGLLPMFYNSNADAAPSGGRNSGEFSPILGATWSTPVFDLPFRFTANGRAEIDRFTQVPTSDFDKLALSGRLQYVDAANDQSWSPYLSYAPRWDFAPFYRNWSATRQDINAGINKIFNFDGAFNRVAPSGNTFEATAWSFGVTAVIQKRFREPTPGSWAAFLVPSATYVISPSWNVSAGVLLERRAFDAVAGFNQEDWLVEPIVTLEFILPATWFGSAANAAAIGRPALDFQVAYEKNWSNLAAATFEVLHVGVALKLGWRF